MNIYKYKWYEFINIHAKSELIQLRKNTIRKKFLFLLAVGLYL